MFQHVHGFWLFFRLGSCESEVLIKERLFVFWFSHFRKNQLILNKLIKQETTITELIQFNPKNCLLQQLKCFRAFKEHLMCVEFENTTGHVVGLAPAAHKHLDGIVILKINYF